jgi:hypothetical protein
LKKKERRYKKKEKSLKKKKDLGNLSNKDKKRKDKIN